MSDVRSPNGGSLKSFRIAYYLDQTFTVMVEAETAEEAERIVNDRLFDDYGILPGSWRTQHGHGTLGLAEDDA